MAQQIIDIGAVANDGQGDTLRVAFEKTNENFTELYKNFTKTIEKLYKTILNSKGTLQHFTELHTTSQKLYNTVRNSTKFLQNFAKL